MSFDLNGLKNGFTKPLKNRLKLMHFFQRLMGSMNRKIAIGKKQRSSAVQKVSDIFKNGYPSAMAKDSGVI